MKQEQDFQDATAAFRQLYPGKKIKVEDIGDVTVYPMGFIHVQRFSRDLSYAISTLTKLAIPVNASAEEKQMAMIGQMIPYVVNNLLGLVEECVEFDKPSITIKALAHWDVPPIIEAWLLESFGAEKKWKPWIVSLERILNQLLKPKEPISILGMLSKHSSALVSQPGKSSTKKPTTSPIPGGASRSSSSISKEPSAGVVD